jgi:hypothetical protein
VKRRCPEAENLWKPYFVVAQRSRCLFDISKASTPSIVLVLDGHTLSNQARFVLPRSNAKVCCFPLLPRVATLKNDFFVPSTALSVEAAVHGMVWTLMSELDASFGLRAKLL